MAGGSRNKVVAVVSLVAALALTGYLFFREHNVKRPAQLSVTTAGYVEMCLSCHKDEKLDTAHDTAVLGCSPCHLGNPLAVVKEEAHAGMVLNPGDLRVVAKTCGVEACHPAEIKKVKNSLMATNRGILATLLYYWGEAEDQNGDYSVEELLKTGQTSLATDYFRKLCATCHLWKPKNDLPGAPAFFNEKGGGCSACHYVLPKGEARTTVISFNQPEQQNQTGQKPPPKKPHPLIIKKIPEENCIRCHNRSGRIGLSYLGIFESEGYGTPYEKGGLSSQRLAGNRFYQKISEDIHHQKGMACIDCHTRDEIMGDGTRPAHFEDALEIRCQTCHSATPGTTIKNHPLNNVDREGERFVLTGKLDAKKHPLDPPSADACLYPGHKRLSCDSCHATWVPQCYGCHIKRDMRDTDLDKLTHQWTPGWWEEGRSYIRYEKPMLGVWKDTVVVVTPGCQDIVTVIDKDGNVGQNFNHFTMAAISPHSTAAKGRTCLDCHASPKTVGLGEGTVTKKDGRWFFRPLDQGLDTPSEKTVGLDAFVTIDGKQLQHGSRADVRPFDKEELTRILRVGLCLECHTDYNDPAYRNYSPQVNCPVYREP